jgi:hypothetical protein
MANGEDPITIALNTGNDVPLVGSGVSLTSPANNGLTVQLPNMGYTPGPGGNSILLPPPTPAQPNALTPTPATAPGGADSYISSFGTHGPEGTGKNPNSSASGQGQFIDETWNSFAKDNPDMFQNMTPQQILAKKADMSYGNKAIEWYAGKNAQVLKDNGIDVTGQNLRVAHGLGPFGAIPVLRAPDSDPMSKYLSAHTLDINPAWKNMTVGQFKGQYAGVPLPENLGGPKYTVAVASNQPDVKPTDTPNPLTMQTPRAALQDPLDMHKLMTMAALQSMLPKGFAFHPVEYDPRKPLEVLKTARGLSETMPMRGMDRSFQEQPVQMRQPAPAISPSGVPYQLGKKGT